jgi:outer membrane protein TolC
MIRMRCPPGLMSLGPLCLALAACAQYQPLALPSHAAHVSSLSDLRQDGQARTAPLTINEVATLALQNNPDLLAARAQHGVAQAQLLQAGLPPNPQLVAAVLPLVAGPGVTKAWNAALSYDIKSLITLSARRRAARDTAQQVDAQLLWQEWQVVGQARLLAVDVIEGERSLGLLRRSRDLLAERERRSRSALAAGNATLSSVAPDVAAFQATQTQVNDLERQQLARRHQLNALLGLAPDVPVPLTSTPDLPSFDPGAAERALPTLAVRRPDLVALQLGYRAQDAKLRAAILAQFPNLTFGVAGGSDNSNVRNIGPQIGLELPIFDRNQGNVAIEQATRQQLHDEYAARLAGADGQVRAMLTEIGLLRRQLSLSRRDLASTARAAREATAALGAANLDERSYVDLVSARYAKEQEVVALEQAVLEQEIAIATLIGAGMPPVSLPPDEVGS